MDKIVRKAYKQAGGSGNGNGNGKKKRGRPKIYPEGKKRGPKGSHCRTIVRQQVIEDCKALVESHAMNLTKHIMEEEARLAFSDIRGLFNEFGEIVPPHELPDDIARAVKSAKRIERTIPRKDDEPIVIVTWEYQFWDKTTALERMSRHLGLYRADNEQKPKHVSVENLNINMAQFTDEELELLVKLGGKLEGDSLQLPSEVIEAEIVRNSTETD